MRRSIAMVIASALVPLGVLLTGVTATAIPTDTQCTLPTSPTPQDCLARITLPTKATFPYYYNYQLDGAGSVSSATEAVIVVHGTDRNAQTYFADMVKAAADAGATQNTVIIAPHYQIAADGPASGDAYWTNGGNNEWKDGDNAASSDATSSYAVIDDIIGLLANKTRFPNLTHIAVVGHSAGGQFVQRYAVGGRAPNQLQGVRVSFVVANPSSYLYFTTARPINTGLPKSCPGYNTYKYGLQSLNSYMSASSTQQLLNQYIGRNVTYLLGGDDIYQSNDIDQTCMAQVQGYNRLERGINYYSYIETSYPAAHHVLSVVPGVGHDNAAMFDSPEGRAAIFN